VQVADGIAAALANARSLVQDAELLLQHQRFPRAAALGILAIEEAGKVPLLRALLLARDERELRDEWRAYRSHTKKNVLHIVPQLVAQGARFLEDLRPVVDSESDHAHVLDALKQVAFYTDAYGTCRWSSPDQAIPADFAKSIVTVAKLLANGGEAMTSVEELDLWVKHVGPVWKGQMWEMSQGLSACYAEAEERGVLKGGQSAREMTRFLFGIG
jgi:AbiV family abortive infection protein